MNFIKDVYKFINYLSIVDVIFFVSIIALLILLVVLAYFIKINKDDVIDNEKDINLNFKEKENIRENTNNELKEIINSLETMPSKEEIEDDEEGELIDLKTLTKKLQEEKENNIISFTDYEKDQEEKAIISYNELLEHQNKYRINYEKEIKDDDVTIKKVNLQELVNKNEIDDASKIDVRVISYEKEEAFLSALKELNRLLN